jgi:Zn-dependent alcohol dehydrogenase
MLDVRYIFSRYPSTAKWRHVEHAVVAYEQPSMGEVVAVGSEVMHVAVGDHVIVPFQLSCAACAPCSAGHTNACAEVAPGTAAVQFILATATPEIAHGS